MSRYEMSGTVVVNVPHDRPAGTLDTYIRLSKLGVYQICWRPNAITYTNHDRSGDEDDYGVSIAIPRCRKCKIRHDRIIAIACGREDDRESSEGESP